MNNKNTNEITSGIMERAAQIPARALQDKTEEKEDDGWGRKRDGPSLAPFKTKGSWAYMRRTLSCNTPVDFGYPPVDPLRPLVEMAAEKVAEYFPKEEISKLALDYVTLIKMTGIKRRQTEELVMKNTPGLEQKKGKREGDTTKFKAGQSPKEGEGAGEEATNPQNKQDDNTVFNIEGWKGKEGGETSS